MSPKSTNSNELLTLNVSPNYVAPSNPIILKNKLSDFNVVFFYKAIARLFPPDTPILFPETSKN